MKLVRAIFAATAAWAVILAAGVVLVPLYFLYKWGVVGESRKNAVAQKVIFVASKALWAMACTVLGIRTKINCSVKPSNGPCLVVANHCNDIDQFVLIAEVYERLGLTAVTSVSKNANKYMPVINVAAVLARVLFIDRSQGDAAVEKIRTWISELEMYMPGAFGIMLFPEGTRATRGKIIANEFAVDLANIAGGEQHTKYANLLPPKHRGFVEITAARPDLRVVVCELDFGFASTGWLVADLVRLVGKVVRLDISEQDVSGMTDEQKKFFLRSLWRSMDARFTERRKGRPFSGDQTKVKSA